MALRHALTNAQWAQIGFLLPTFKRERPSSTGSGLFIDAVIWRAKNRPCVARSSLSLWSINAHTGHAGGAKSGGLDQAADDDTEGRLKSLREQSAAQDISASQAARAAYTVGTGHGTASSLSTLAADPAGTAPAATTKARAALSNLPDTGGYSELMAFKVLMESASKNFDSQARAHSAAMQSSLGKQAAIAQDALDKAKADQKSATFSFMTNIMGAGVAFGMGAYGAGGKAAKGPKAGSESTSVEQIPVRTGATGALTQKEDVDISRATQTRASREERRAAEAKTHENEEQRLEQQNAGPQDEKEHRRIKQQQLGHENEQSDITSAESGTAQKRASEGANRAGVYAASNSASQLITSGGEAVNQNLLYGAESHAAEVQQKLDELGKSIADQMLEGSKTNKEKSAKMVDDAISSLKQHFDLVKSTNDRIGG